MLSVDTNVLVHAADPDSVHHQQAFSFFLHLPPHLEFVLCELVVVELYMLLRNPAVFRRPYSPDEAAGYCRELKKNPKWRCVDYDPAVSKRLWDWAQATKTGFRQIIDARLALTLRHHGVTEFATANVKDFREFGFSRVFNPLEA